MASSERTLAAQDQGSRLHEDQISIAAGQTSNPIYINDVQGNRATVNAIPGAGGTLLVQYTMSPYDIVAGNQSGTVNWINWPSGTVGIQTSDTLLSRVTAVRATAAGATGTLEVCQ